MKKTLLVALGLTAFTAQSRTLHIEITEDDSNSHHGRPARFEQDSY